MNFSLAYTFFQTLSLGHLERSLYSISRQTKLPDDMVFFDNNTTFSEDVIKLTVAKHFNLSQWRFYFSKHGDTRKTSASWSQNQAIKLTVNDVLILARADIIYEFSCFGALLKEFSLHSNNGINPLHFVTCHVKHMDYFNKSYTFETADDAADLEPLKWRDDVQRLTATTGRNFTETHLDAVSFCTTKAAMAAVDWYDESLQSWGMWQQSLQMDMREKGIATHVIPETLMFHMQHGADRNTARAMNEFNSSPRRSGIRNNFIP